MRGTRSPGLAYPGGGQLLMPQPILRHIARRAMQVAIAAAGILIVLLVFSRQAHAATLAAPTPSAGSAPAVPAPAPSASSAPAAPAPAPSVPAPSVASAVASVAAPVTSVTSA